jgi:hypothetical protein
LAGGILLFQKTRYPISSDFAGTAYYETVDCHYLLERSESHLTVS